MVFIQGDPVIVDGNYVDMALAGCILYAVFLLVSRFGRRRVSYIDGGRSKVFYSSKYGISAKPDLIQDKNTIVEKKSRTKGVYKSDVAQLVASALAVRSEYAIKIGFIVTKTDKVEVDLSGSDSDLFDMISSEYSNARLILSGKTPPASPSKAKCGSCQFRKECNHSV